MKMYEIKSEIYKLVEDNKLITRASIDEKEMGRFLNFVDEVNALGRKDCRLSNGKTLTEYKFPEVFKELIYPDAIVLAGGVKYVDFLSRPKVEKNDDETLMTPFEMESFITRLYGMYRKTKADSELSDLKQEVTVKDADITKYYLDENSKDSVCPAMDDNIFPIPLTIRVTNQNYCYVGVEEQILRYLSLILSKFRA
jgi:hypothetical protein